MARWTRAVGTIKTKRAGFNFANARLAVRAGIAGVEQSLLPLVAISFGLVHDRDDAFAVPRGESHRFAQPGIDAVADYEPVDHGFDVVQLLWRELGNFVE